MKLSKLLHMRYETIKTTTHIISTRSGSNNDNKLVLRALNFPTKLEWYDLIKEAMQPYGVSLNHIAKVFRTLISHPHFCFSIEDNTLVTGKYIKYIYNRPYSMPEKSLEWRRPLGFATYNPDSDTIREIEKNINTTLKLFDTYCSHNFIRIKHILDFSNFSTYVDMGFEIKLFRKDIRWHHGEYSIALVCPEKTPEYPSKYYYTLSAHLLRTHKRIDDFVCSCEVLSEAMEQFASGLNYLMMRIYRDRITPTTEQE